MNKIAIGLSLLLTLLVLVTELSSVNLVSAMPTPWTEFPSSPVTNKPIIKIQSPLADQVINSNNAWLNFSITKPENWFPPYYGGISINGDTLFLILGKLTSVNYTVDNGKPQSLNVYDTQYILLSSPQQTFQFNIKLNLLGGEHKVQLSFEADCYYLPTDNNILENTTFINAPGMSVVGYASVKMYGTTEPVSFTVAPFIVTPKEEIYNEISVPLAFIIDNSTVSWIGYSLDGRDNSTIMGNTTLTGLTNGAHNVTIFVKDSFDNMHASQSAYFTVNAPEPTPITSKENFPVLPITSFMIAVALVSIGLVIYLKKRKIASKQFSLKY